MEIKTIAIIPARANSKGVPGKNKRELNGVPLVAYTVMDALNTPEIDLTVISTEDEETAVVALKYADRLGRRDGFAWHERPEEFSLDWVQNDDVALQVVREIECPATNSKKFDLSKLETVVILQPTSPFRNVEDISTAIQQHVLLGETTIIGGTRFHGYLWQTDHARGVENPLFHDPLNRRGRQWEDPQDLWQENGSLYVCSVEKIKAYRTFRAPPHIIIETDWYSNIDINTEHDWMVAEAYAKTLWQAQ